MSAITRTGGALAMCAALSTSGCAIFGSSDVSLLTSKANPTPAGKEVIATYYLPRKQMEATATYTITFEKKYKLDKTLLAAFPNSSRHYSREQEGEAKVVAVKVSDEVPLLYRVESDPEMGFWLASSNKRGLDDVDITFTGDGHEVIKAINSTFTPVGQEVTTTVVKAVTSIIPYISAFAGTPSDPNSKTSPGTKSKEPDRKPKYAEDSLVKVSQQVVVKKSVNVGDYASDIKSANGRCVLKFSDEDLSLGNHGLKVPTIEVWVHALPLSSTATKFYEEVAKEYNDNFTQPSDVGGLPTVDGTLYAQVPNSEESFLSSTPAYDTHVAPGVNKKVVPVSGPASSKKSNKITGILYRTPLICDVIVKVKHPDQKEYSFASLANRTSFPQLGAVAVAPVVFSRKRGKQVTTWEFNVDNGGIVKVKTTREKSLGKTVEESGTMTKVLLETLKKERDENSDLQNLKNQNSLLEEQLKKLDLEKKLNEQTSSQP